MFGIYGKIALALAVAAIVGWIVRVDQLRAHWHGQYDALSKVSGGVLKSIRIASNNRTLGLRDAADQVDIIAASRIAWKGTAELQSSRIDELGNETARLKALNAEQRKRAEASIAKREGAIKRLSTQALTPGERGDCAKQIADAEAALDLVYQEGL